MLLHHVAHDFDATRRFLFLQVHPVIWWGNIVAGVVVFIVINICWQWFLKKWVKAGLSKLHRKDLATHHEEVVKPLLEAQHKAVLEQAAKHHDEHMLKLSEALAPKRRAPAVKKVAAKKPAAKKVTKKVAAKQLAKKVHQ